MDVGVLKIKKNTIEIANLETQPQRKVCLIGIGEPMTTLQQTYINAVESLTIFMVNFGKEEQDFINILLKINPNVELNFVFLSKFNITLNGLNLRSISNDKNCIFEIINDPSYLIINNMPDVLKTQKPDNVTSLNLRKKTYEIFFLLIDGLSYKDIADQINMSLDSVRFNVKKIYSEANVKSRSELSSKFHNGQLRLNTY